MAAVVILAPVDEELLHSLTTFTQYIQQDSNVGLSTTIALPALPPTLAFSPVLVSATAALVATGASSHNPFTASPGNTFHRAIHCVCVVGEAGFECGGRRFKGEVGAGMSIEGWGDIETPGED
ncbi:hypothetical protein M422DRAFT_247308 [Sphaerobolus stellatus SS14]|nr:hypothetical protein M422DRAFT_247308 [Sphaerobolus stellatus SS14]